MPSHPERVKKNYSNEDYDLCPVCHGADCIADGPDTKPCPNPKCFQGLVKTNA